MPRRKENHTASLRHRFSDGDDLTRTLGEVLATKIEQAALLLALAKESGDVASIAAAKAMRKTAINTIDEWAGKVLNRQIKAEKGAKTLINDRQKANAKPLKRDLALKEIERLGLAGKGPKSIPGILEKKGICSARYARSLMEEKGG
jgi:hypothetical protein